MLSSATAPAASAHDDAREDAAQLQLLRFALGDERYALRIEAVREILEVAKTTPLPLMPAFVRGLMNLRGGVVPVIDLGARLGLPPACIGRRSCVVVVDAPCGEDGGLQRLGLLVDAVSEVFDVALDEVEPVPRLGSRIDPSFLRSMVRVRGQATPELNLETVLDLQVLSELIAGHAAVH